MRIRKSGIEAAREIEFGEIEDFYPEHEITAGKRARWNASRREWEGHKAAAIGYAEDNDPELCHESIAAAAGAEQDWGDTPSSRELRRLLLIGEEG